MCGMSARYIFSADELSAYSLTLPSSADELSADNLTLPSSVGLDHGIVDSG